MTMNLLALLAVVLASSASHGAPSGSETTAKVVETPPRVMTIQPLATFNNGKPFLGERDPVTGAFDLRTTPVNTDDYLYEEFEDSGEAIDRKDEAIKHTANHIISIPAKDSELHKFLNLPVHYSSASKFPLISSSYANTKIQGHGASNHRPATSTPSTVQPSYYPHRTTASSTTTSKSTTSRPSTTKITTTARSTSKTTTTTPPPPPPPAYEYEYEYDYNEPNKPASESPTKSDYDFMGFFNFGASSSSTTFRPTERSTTTTASPPPRETSTTTTTTTMKPSTTEDDFVTKPTQVSTTRVPSTTSQKPKVENEPKPSITVDNTMKKTSPAPSQQESTMIAIKSETVPNRNKSDNVGASQTHLKDSIKTSEVIGLQPPFKTPDSVMKPPPQYGDKIEVTQVENGGWLGKPELSSENKSTSPSSIPSQSSGHAKPFEPKPEGTNQVKYSVNRPHEMGTNRPIEFHQHLVSQLSPMASAEVEEHGEPEKKVDHKSKDEVPPQVVVPISSTPQGLQLPQQRPNTEVPPAAPNSYPAVVTEKPSAQRPSDSQSRPPSVTFPEVESPQLRPQQSYGAEQVYHATINDEKPLRLPASTYLQRPLVYGAPPQQPPKDKGQSEFTGQVESEDNVVFNKVSYRPQPGLVSSYQPQSQQRPGQAQPSGFASQPSHSTHLNQPPHSSHLQQSSHNLHSSYMPQPNYPQPPAPYHVHKVQPQPFGSPNAQHNQPSGPAVEEKRPVAWPPKGKPVENQKVPPFTFFPRPEQRPAPGVGTVEPVRAPPRQPNKGTVAVSNVGSDTQSYSLQTSFSIGVPSGHLDEGKVTAGTVSSVPIAQALGSQGTVTVGHQPSLGQPQHQSGPPQLAQPISANTIKYPSPPWEGNLNKPYKESAKRKPLPNILPQFRPNAKVGTAEPPGPHLMGVNYMREPVDRLQPPPLPLPPQPRPIHRSDEQHQLYPPQRPVAAYLRAEPPADPQQRPSAIHPPQPVHRRNGVGTKVTTLQMIQSPPPVTRKTEEPVMIVYPSNNAEASALKGNLQQPDFGNDDEFPHDLEDARTKDTPILKGKPPTAKPPIKVEFPYPLVKPLPEGEIKEYQAYVPTSPAPEKVTSSENSPISHHLQDYHPAMGTSSSSSTLLPPRRVVPMEAEFGWSVIGARTDEDLTTTPDMGSSTSGPMAPPQLTGGFRPIPAPNLD